MEFPGFLGNERLKSGLSAAFARGAVSHCYLLCGPDGSGKHTLARILVAAMQCTGEKPPCCRCNACKKVFDGVHPDVISVSSDKQLLGVEPVRQARADAFIRPNEGAKKIYVLAQQMSEAAQNALLKIIEEPPPYGVFLILAENPAQLLPTVRSRCAVLQLDPLDDRTMLSALEARFPDRPRAELSDAARRAGGYLGQAETLLARAAPMRPETERFAEDLAAGDALLLLQALVPLEKSKRDDLSQLLVEWRALVADALRARSGLPAGERAARLAKNRTARELISAAQTLRRAQTCLDANVSCAHVCGALAALLS